MKDFREDINPKYNTPTNKGEDNSQNESFRFLQNKRVSLKK